MFNRINCANCVNCAKFPAYPDHQRTHSSCRVWDSGNSLFCECPGIMNSVFPTEWGLPAADGPAPAEVRFAHDNLHQAIQQFLGLQDKSPLVKKLDGQSLNGKVVVSVAPSRRTRQRLAQQGYARQRSFISINRAGRPFLLIPSDSPELFSAGLQIYVPQKSRGKVLKAFASKLPWIGAPKWLPQRLTIASKGALPLEALITKLTGEKSPVFAWLLNLYAHSSKINMQVMRPDGEILGYIKLSLSKVASHSLRHEASVLSQLRTYPELRASIPQVLYGGDWSDSYLIFVSRLAGKSGPLAFTSSHARFLQTLAAIRPVKRGGELLMKETRGRWEQSLPRLGSEWVKIGQSALEKANRLLAGQSVPCGVIHGDFVPENTMMSNDRLLVFDWERSVAGRPSVWDLFHFHLELAYLLEKRVEDVFSVPESPVDHACWLLYLLGSTCRLSEAEQTRASAIRIRYRRQLLSQDASRWLS